MTRAVTPDAVAREREAAAALAAFPRGPMGLTPDSVKASPEWQAAKAAWTEAFSALRAYNRAKAKGAK